ncbi:MAG: DUF1134 domain-containing protein [Rhodospirillales bacterium]|nr:DUF1134 domain-containing protein [Rhodospirillales bacterium]
MSRNLLTRRDVLIGASATAGLAAVAPQAFAAKDDDGKTFSKNEIMQKAEGFFGATTKGLAEVIEKAFADHGRPNALILGSEAGGAFVVGVRFGEGHLERKQGAGRKLYWQGPSAGFDFGGNASKVFTMIYHLSSVEEMFQRYPGVDGSLYVVAGLGLNYQQSGKVILAPIRTGVGLRAGANVGYLHYTREHSWIPL